MPRDLAPGCGYPWSKGVSNLGERQLFDHGYPQPGARSRGIYTIQCGRCRHRGPSTRCEFGRPSVPATATLDRVNASRSSARLRVPVVKRSFKSGVNSTVQHTWALILGLARNIARDDAAVKRGAWPRSPSVFPDKLIPREPCHAPRLTAASSRAIFRACRHRGPSTRCEFDRSTYMGFDIGACPKYSTRRCTVEFTPGGRPSVPATATLDRVNASRSSARLRVPVVLLQPMQLPLSQI
jgi:hypothetical protein